MHNVQNICTKYTEYAKKIMPEHAKNIQKIRRKERPYMQNMQILHDNMYAPNFEDL